MRPWLADDAAWVAQQTATLPERWQRAITRQWRGSWAMLEGQRRAANLQVVRAVAMLADAGRAGLRHDATDADIKQRASEFVRHYHRATHALPVDLAAKWAAAEMERHGMGDAWPKVAKPKMNDRAAVARVCCEVFWRRVLRKVFARTIEQCSIGLGLVNRSRDCYVSDLSVKRRRAQVASAAAMMDATELENELGQRLKLSDLAAKSMANKAVRRAELMTRISGFEKVADDVGHVALFTTVTCPSRMHKWTDGARGVRPNPRFDGTTPREAQQYLSGQWAKMRASLKRAGLDVYGFRVCEPHHDGCPHWHLLFFMAAEAMPAVQARFLRYFLSNDSATERGAADRRVTFEKIDRTKGSAVAYIAKYISKNVDGYRVDYDLYGAPAIESSARVDAWAATWRVRQFQQIGGAPVTVWRELRRLNPDNLPADLLPDSLTDAVRGVNIGQMGGLLAHGWQAYTMAQGGPCVNRKHQKIKLLRQQSGEVNRYSEVKSPDVIGIEASGKSYYVRQDMAAMNCPVKLARPAFARIESERLQWSPVVAGALPRAPRARPWTRVNNCTRTVHATADSMREIAFVTRSKTGRFKAWKKSGEAGAKTEDKNHDDHHQNRAPAPDRGRPAHPHL